MNFYNLTPKHYLLLAGTAIVIFVAACRKEGKNATLPIGRTYTVRPGHFSSNAFQSLDTLYSIGMSFEGDGDWHCKCVGPGKNLVAGAKYPYYHDTILWDIPTDDLR